MGAVPMNDPPPLPETLRVLPGNWLWPQDVRGWFGNSRPVELDLGCGKGRFRLERARTHREVNLLGIERQLERVRKIDRKALRRGLDNIRLLRLEGYYAVRYLLPEALLSACYVFFPDPWPKERHGHHRIFNPEFLTSLRRVLAPGAPVHFATDHLPYFTAVVELVKSTGDWREIIFVPTEAERTDFELMFLRDKPVGRFSFQAAG
ncbi:MAG: tRNA (guanosine(46)-N7)-methyltransferase TrmB [Kiritimatiellia bacterium]